MPILQNTQFINNTNADTRGAGALSIIENFENELYPVSLTVDNCVFDSNEGGYSSAIAWQGVQLAITNSIFIKNFMLTGAAVNFWQTYLAENPIKSSLIITN